jgi:hypothetical protein
VHYVMLRDKPPVPVRLRGVVLMCIGSGLDMTTARCR